MDKKFIKNVEHAKVFKLGDLLAYNSSKVVDLNLAQKGDENFTKHGITILAFKKGQEIGTHSSQGDVLITILEGETEFTIDKSKCVLKAGESIVLPANVSHSVKSITDFKMLLIVVTE